MKHRRSQVIARRVFAAFAVAGAVIVTVGIVRGWEFIDIPAEIALVHQPAFVEHADQAELNALGGHEAFEEAFEIGDEIFATAFNALDGGGANVGQGQRYTRTPRADLKGNQEWFRHTPARVTGPNAAGCFECHEKPFEDAAGGASSNVHRDPFRTANLGLFIQRNTPHLFAPGAIQRLAEEMTDALTADQNKLRTQTCKLSVGGSSSVQLQAKGVSFGTLGATKTGASPCRVTFNTSDVQGIDFLPSVDNPAAPPELIVRPFQWKGSVGFVRDFNRGAAHNELGMQAVEVVGDDVDGDFDGVANEMTIGDMTALAIYMAAQPRPTTLQELNSLGLLDPPLTNTQNSQITRGLRVFKNIGCATCHVPSLPLVNPVYSEPSQNAAYRDGVAFPAGQNTLERGVDPAHPITFDLTQDQPDNVIHDAGGNVIARLGSFTRKDSAGRAVIELFGDLKRHRMGEGLEESVNEIAGDDVTPIPSDPRNRHTPDTFLTENLWGVGSTSPYMHDGRATTLTEAILIHAVDNDPISEAAYARDQFIGLPLADQQALIAFLDNLVLFKIAEEEPAAAAASSSSALSAFSALSATSAPRTVVRIAPKGFKIKLPGQ